MFSQILVPLDGTAESKAALPAAQMLARETRAKITLLRVVQEPDSLSERSVFDETSAELDGLAKNVRSGGIEVESVVRRGDVVDVILQQIRQRKIDLLVMRTHGRVGLSRAMLGSVTESVLAESSIPVVLVRPDDRQVTHLRRLLVPIDGSPGGAVALGTAISLAKSSGAAMSLLQVAVPIPLYAYTAGMYGGMTYVDPSWDEDALASAQSYVESIVQRLRNVGIEVDGEARMAPDVAETIAAAADRVEADLIVMSTHALHGPVRALLGSVADAVVRHAHIPVLLVHRGPADQVTEPSTQPSAAVPVSTSASSSR